MLKKEGYWETYYVCSICGEHSSFQYNECPFCHNSMKNPKQSTDDKETHGAGTVYDWDKPHEI